MINDANIAARDAFERIGEAALLASAWQSGLLPAVIAGPVRESALVDRLGLDRRAARLTLDGLATLGFVERDGEWVRTGEAVRALEGLPLRAGQLGALWAAVPRWLSTGRSVASWGGNAAERSTTYAEAVGALADWTEDAADELAAQLGPAGRVLDLGAGSAVWSLAMARRHPETRVWAVDMPAVLEVAARRAATTGHALTVVPGDLFEVELPEVDRVVLGNLVHLFDEPTAIRLVQRAVEALAPGGELVVIDVAGDGSPEQARAVALYAVQLALRVPDGHVWSVDTLRGWLADAGLTEVGVVPLERATHPLVAMVARY